MSVCAIIVTRGDQDLTPVAASIPAEWDMLVWDNGRGKVSRRVMDSLFAQIVTGQGELPDLAVYGRYAAIEYTDAELIYVQDDDCVVSDPRLLVEAWHEQIARLAFAQHHVVCNMPQEFRHEFYEEHALVGFGAAFHRDAPFRAFARAADALPHASEEDWLRSLETPLFQRNCDMVFTALTPRVLVDVPKEDLPWAHYEDRMWKQPGHQAARVRMLDFIRQITVESTSQR